MKEIPVARSLIPALVDDSDFDWAVQYKWSIAGAGYAVRQKYIGRVDGKEKYKKIYMHRELLGLKEGDGIECDHINRVKTDNRRSNLRIATRLTNNANRPPREGSASKYKGVRKSSKTCVKPWMASMSVDNKEVVLGRFWTEEEAAVAYNDAAAKRYGDFAYLNEIPV